MSEEVLLARAYLSRVAEPSCIPLWRDVAANGPVAVADAIRSGDVAEDLHRATSSRAREVDPGLDLEAADRHGVRLLVPEGDGWPHVALAALEAAGRRRLVRYEAGERAASPSGELIPPIALWARGPHDLGAMGFRSAGLVGSRACTSYGEQVTKDLAFGLAERGFDIVSGGAFGIDAAAHRAALAARSTTVIVSAGGPEGVYPPAHERLFAAVAESGAIVSESPPGSAPQRRRFLTRNRLIASLATGTVVVEAARRSGAMNTAAHCRGLERAVMAVPGPVTSAMSVGCHMLLAAEFEPARLVCSVDDVLACIGAATDVPIDPLRPAQARPHDALDASSRQVLDGVPARGAITLDRLLVTSGVDYQSVLRSLPILQMYGLLSRSDDGRYRLVRR